MRLDEYYKKVNNLYRECMKQGYSNIEIERNALFELNKVELSLDEFMQVLFYTFMHLRDKVMIEAERESNLAAIKKYLLENYSAALEINDNKPSIQENYSAWLNLDTNEISIVKPYNAFAAKDNNVKIENFTLAGITWKNIVADKEG